MNRSARTLAVLTTISLLGAAESALAQAGGGQAQSPWIWMMPYALIFVIFYLLLIRPQQQKVKQHQAMLDALQKGDEVVTAGGIHGKVHGLTDTLVTLEVAQNVRIKVSRGRIDGKAVQPEPASGGGKS